MTPRPRSRGPVLERRRTLRALAAAALLPAAAVVGQSASLTPTPSQTEGPFYPKTIPADHDGDLTRVVGRAAEASGTPLYFSESAEARKQLTMALGPAASGETGALAGTFDFVIR